MTSRQEAISWYQNIYDDPSYAMGHARFEFAAKCLSLVPRGSLLDIGCGRGEMLNEADSLGFTGVTGCEVSRNIIETDARICYGEAQKLPFSDNEFDVVTMFDVMEHLPEDDILDVLFELKRVAKKTIMLTVSNRPSIVDGRDLHITKHPYDEWDSLFNDMFGGSVVRWMKNPIPCVSELWRIDL